MGSQRQLPEWIVVTASWKRCSKSIADGSLCVSSHARAVPPLRRI